MIYSFAFAEPISDNDIISSAKSDSIARAAFKQASGKDCKTEITQRPLAKFQSYQIQITCTQKSHDEVGDGVYLQIKISGQFWGKTSGDVQKIEIMRAG